MKKLLLFFQFAGSLVYGQSLDLVGAGNTSGIYSCLNNPAYGLNGPDWLSVNLAGAGASMESNALYLSLDYSLWQMLSGKPKRQQRPGVTYPLYALDDPLPKKPVMHLNAQILLPSFRVKLTEHSALFAYARDRIVGSNTELGSSLLPVLTQQQIDPLAGQPDLALKIRMAGYREYGAGISQVIVNELNYRIILGATFKYTVSRFAYIVELRNVSVEHNGTEAGLNARFRLASTNLKQKYPSTSDLFGFGGGIGTGMGADIGMVFESRPARMRHRFRINNPGKKTKHFRQRTETLYNWRVAVSLNDLGYVNMEGAGIQDAEYNFNQRLEPQPAPNPKEPQKPNFKEWAEKSDVISSSNQLSMKLPANLRVAVDIRLNRKWFLYTEYIQNLRDRSVMENLYQPSSLSLFIRKESAYFTFGFPLRIVPESRSLGIGALMKAGPFFLGTNNVFVPFRTKAHNLSLYTGLCFNIRYKRDPSIERFKAF